jgi:hypothetical protein
MLMIAMYAFKSDENINVNEKPPSDKSLLIGMILEPTNLATLQAGQPLITGVNEFIPEATKRVDIGVAYSPDVEWLSGELKRRQRSPITGEEFTKIMRESMQRVEVYRGRRAS